MAEHSLCAWRYVQRSDDTELVHLSQWFCLYFCRIVMMDACRLKMYVFTLRNWQRPLRKHTSTVSVPSTTLLTLLLLNVNSHSYQLPPFFHDLERWSHLLFGSIWTGTWSLWTTQCSLLVNVSSLTLQKYCKTAFTRHHLIIIFVSVCLARTTQIHCPRSYCRLVDTR